MTSETLQPQRWRDLSVKDKAALVTACISFSLGFILLFTGMFIAPAGVIDASVLTGFGTALLYTAGIFGVAMYFKNGNAELMNSIMDSVNKAIEKRFEKDGSSEEG